MPKFSVRLVTIKAPDADTAAALAVNNANWQLSTGDVSVEATEEIR